MTELALVLTLLAAAAALPAGPSAASARLRTLRPESAPAPAWGRRAVARIRGGAGLLALTGGTTFAVAAHLVFGASLPVLPALAGLLAGGAAGRTVSSSVAGRRRRRQEAALVESVGALAADLRAGQHPEAALAAAAAGPAAGHRLRSPAVAAVWMVSERSGAPAAAVLDRVEQDLRARERQRREVAAQLAGARSTAALLAVLPVLGISLGAAMGARPLDVLFGTAAGQAALVLGAGLDAAGVLWTARIVEAAEGEP